mmetsp:Transcript_48906/g.116252  ORF Transcript_48906/g.116252 Transcript_48906/m.116252 type:complete len:268 (+) Transcript_48906:262-1065(+)
MEDILAALPHRGLKYSSGLYRLLQQLFIVVLSYELQQQLFQDNVRRYASCQQFIERTSHQHRLLGTLLLQDHLGTPLDGNLPCLLWDRHVCSKSRRASLSVQGFQGQQCSAQITSCLLRNPACKFTRNSNSLRRPDLLQGVANFIHAGCRDADRQTPASQWRNDFGCRISCENDSACLHVLLHGSAESRLGLVRQSPRIFNDNDLEGMNTERRMSCNLLDQLHHYSCIPVANICWRQLHVIVGNNHLDIYSVGWVVRVWRHAACLNL